MAEFPAADFIKVWRKEAADNLEDEQIRTVITRCFDGLKCLNSENSPEALQYLIESMRTEREVAFKFDTKVDADPIRLFVYGINEAIQKTIENAITKTGGDVATLPTRSVKVEDAPDPIPSQEPENNSNTNDSNSVVVPNPPLTGNGTTATDGVMAPLINDSQTTNGSASVPLANAVIPSSLQTGNGTSATDGVINPGVVRKAGGGGRRAGGILSKMRTLTCPNCTVTGLHFSGLNAHLRNVHKTTPRKANITFKCTCGFTGCNYADVWAHSHSCAACELSVIPLTH